MRNPKNVEATAFNAQVLAERLRLARQMSGMTQKQVGKTLGLHRVTISNFEASVRNPLACQLLPLSRIFDVSVGWLVGEADPELTLAEDKVKLAAEALTGLSDEQLGRLLNVIHFLKRDDQMFNSGRSS